MQINGVEFGHMAVMNKFMVMHQIKTFNHTLILCKRSNGQTAFAGSMRASSMPIGR